MFPTNMSRHLWRIDFDSVAMAFDSVAMTFDSVAMAFDSFWPRQLKSVVWSCMIARRHQ